MSLQKKYIQITCDLWFFESQFSYCPLIWMLHCRTNRLHDRALRIVYSDYKSLFNTLLENDGSFQSNKEIFTVYLLKYINSLHDLSPAITGNIIKLNGPPKYNLRTWLELRNRNKKTVKYDTQTKSFFSSENSVSSSSKYKTLHLSFII